MYCVCELQRGHSGDGCDLASTLFKYDLGKGDLFVLSWARMQQVRRGSISSELRICGDVSAVFCYFILCGWLPRGNKCMYMGHFCFMSVVMTVWGSVGMFVM